MEQQAVATSDRPGAAVLPLQIVRALQRVLSLASEAPAIIGQGLDVTAWRIPAVDGDWTLRVPLHPDALAAIAVQTRLNARLAIEGLPVPRDAMLVHGGDGEALGGLYRYVSGDHAVARGRRERRRLAATLAAFLSRLHDVPADVAAECGATPYDPWRDRFQSAIERCLPLLPARSAGWVRAVGERLADCSDDLPPPVLIHGDLKPEHVVIDDAGGCTVLDFEGAHVTDPAIDLARLVQNWDRAFAERVLDGYGGAIDVSMRARADCYVALDPVELLDVAHQRGWGDWEHVARRMIAARAARGTGLR